MAKRFMVIGFPQLTTDWLTLRRPELKELLVVFALPDHGRMVITAVNSNCQAQGISKGMVVADAKAMVTGLQVFDDQPARAAKLLKGIGEWCIRYTPLVSVSLPDSLILNITGCTHLWGGEQQYLTEVVSRLNSKGYQVSAAIADTIGTAWAISHYSQGEAIVPSGEQVAALLPLPPDALRLEPVITERLHKLGFNQVKTFIDIPRTQLRRRFGEGLLLRLNQALGLVDEHVQSLQPIEPYQERLSCLEPICTATGIEIAIKRLLETLCERLCEEGKGIRSAVLKCYRIDGKTVQAEIGTSKASHHTEHLFKLFELHIATIEPALGIELFVMEATKVDDVEPQQEALWIGKPTLNDKGLAELVDRLAGKVGADSIHRYLPQEHYWPEWSVKNTLSLMEAPATLWRKDKPRPTQLLFRPELIEVTAPIPDYPPMLFRYQGKVHPIKKADGPERIEREWWLDEGEHRDYYMVEDDQGQRYWLFRSGHYSASDHRWFIHGFFA